MRCSFTAAGTSMRTLFIIAVLAFSQPSVLAAASLTQLLGVDDSVDHATLDAQGLLDQARDDALTAESNLDDNVKARLGDIDTEVDKTVANVGLIEKDATLSVEARETQAIAELDKLSADIKKFEEKTKDDMSQLIDKLNCVSDLTATEYAGEVLGAAGKWLGGNEIELTAPVLYKGEKLPDCISEIFDCTVKKTFQIDDMFSNTYDQVKSYLIDRLDGLREDTPAETVINTYAYLSNLAMRATCHMPENANVDDFANYARLARSWRIATGR
jgi:hypothetical protein